MTGHRGAATPIRPAINLAIAAGLADTQRR